MIELRYTFGGEDHRITRESVVAAMRRYDRLHQGRSVRRTGSKYYVWWKGRPYPPKEIVRYLDNGPKGKFSGGSATNQVFTGLKFYVGRGKFPTRVHGSDVAIPSLLSLQRRLLSLRWKKLEHNFLPNESGKYPGRLPLRAIAPRPCKQVHRTR